MTDFPLTWLRWYNDAGGAKVACVSGSYEALPEGSRSEREFHAEGKPPHPEHGQFQWGIACSRTSRVIVVDVDHPEKWGLGEAYVELGPLAEVATSVREDGARAHLVLTVPEGLLHLWPRQGPAVWGDVKSNGFSYVSGVHKSGLRYVQVREPLEATPEVLGALTRDRIFPQGGREGTGGGTMSAPWEDDGCEVTSHDECVATVMSMVRAGLSEDAIIARLDVIMPSREGSWPGREAYVDEKIRSAQRKSAESDARAMRPWELRSGLPYEELAALVTSRTAQEAAAASPPAIARDAEHISERAAREGFSLTPVPVARRLNPHGLPVEPPGSSDLAVGGDIMTMALPSYRIASDEGGWLQNAGPCWERWGTRAEASMYGGVIAMSYGQFLKSDDALAEELASQGTAPGQEAIDADERRRERLGKVRHKLHNTAGQGSVGSQLVRIAHSDSRYSVRVADLDSEPDVLWAGGYPWSLLHPELTLATDVRAVSPVHLKTAACAPRPGPSPAFDAVLASVWPDAEVRAWALREIAGVIAWGATSKMHPVLDGPPQGGKSTLALILKVALGGYAVQVSPDKILGTESGSAAEEEIAAMMGARMVWMDEPPPGGKQAISRFNDLASGTGELSASKKYSNRVSAPKLFNFLICQNARNALRMDAQGVAERITIIPCEGTPESTMAAREAWLRQGDLEYPAILARLVRECALFRTGRRLPVPHAVAMARDDAQARSDEFGTWLLDNFTIIPDADKVPTTDPRLAACPTQGALRTVYNSQHARVNKLSVLGAAEVQAQLRRLGLRVTATGPKSSRRINTVLIEPKNQVMGMYPR